MKMKDSIIIYFMALAGCFLEAFATNTCSIVNEINSCTYTIECDIHAGVAASTSCSSNYNVEFVMQNSNLITISPGFFGATNFDSRVRKFVAKNNIWINIETEAFKYYTKTTEMNLRYNNIKTIANLAFNKLVNLNYLDLSDNIIYEIQPKSLFTSDTLDSEIKVLNISHNEIGKISNVVFSRMPNLMDLYLQNNKIYELADDAFHNLKKLVVLNLSNNRISSLNLTLINLKLLERLDFSQNELKIISGFQINRLSALKFVNLSNNLINIVESNCFTQALNLEILDLSNNRITSLIESVMFINNVNLKQLYLQNNYITQIQDNSFKHNVLANFSVKNNKLSTAISQYTFTGLTDITKLDLSNQNITGLKNYSFSDMFKLQYLNLSRNRIETVEVLSFEKSIATQILDLSHNYITNIDFITLLNNLTQIFLNNNKINLLKSYVFGNQTKLEKLDLSNNKIVKIEMFALPLIKLQYLNVINNSLSGTIEKNVFSPAKYLRYLDLSSMNFSRIEEISFTDLPNLAWLNISNNAITYISPNNFINLRNIFRLDLSHNKLNSLQTNNNISLPNLQSLYLENNNLKSLPNINATSLNYLTLSHNNISNLINNQFKIFKNLKVLVLSFNKIKLFNNAYTNLLADLTILDLNNNEISVINATYFPKLVHLDVHNNTLASIENCDLKNLNNLQLLDISLNKIREIPPGTFQRVNSLKQLNISSNLVFNLRYGSFKGLSTLETLDLSRNNLSNIDVEIFHECYSMKRLIMDFNYLKEVDMERLINVIPKIKSISIGGNLVACKEIVRHVREFNKTVEVTAVEKVYHEDNVHGIKCGDTTKTEVPIEPNEHKMNDESNSGHAIIFTFVGFTVVTLVICIILLVMYNRRIRRYIESGRPLNESISFRGSTFQNDLLT